MTININNGKIMTTEEKDLLRKDLCARLPYGVICQYNCVIPCGRITLEKVNERDVLKGIIPMSDGHIGFMVGIDKVNALEGDIKPCLRSMSSMTEEEEIEFEKIFELELKALESPEGHTIESAASSVFAIDFYNKYHFDYRGLIEKGLAIAVTEENNPYKE